MTKPAADPPETSPSDSSSSALESRLQQMLISASYSGPIPPPTMLRELDAIDPGRAAKLLQLAEDQSRHRMKLEETVILSDIHRSWSGLAAGFLVAIFTIGVGGYVAVYSSPGAGATIATATVVGLAGVFVYGTLQRRQEREKKAELLKRKSG